MQLYFRRSGILESSAPHSAGFGQQPYGQQPYRPQRGMDEPELKIMDVFVCKLRKKLAQATGGSHYIETVWGRGLYSPRSGQVGETRTRYRLGRYRGDGIELRHVR